MTDVVGGAGSISGSADDGNMKHITLFDGTLIAAHMRGALDIDIPEQPDFWKRLKDRIFATDLLSDIETLRQLNGSTRLRAWRVWLR